MRLYYYQYKICIKSGRIMRKENNIYYFMIKRSKSIERTIKEAEQYLNRFPKFQ